MLWFLNNPNPNPNPNNTIEFYQVFTDCDKVYTDEEFNTIYSFDSTKHNKSKFNTDNIAQYKSTNIECKIKIIDHIISYNIENQKTKVFAIETNFINPINNQYGIPIFTHAYKPVSEKKLPNLMESGYTYIHNLSFEIFNMEPDNHNAQFVIETNLSTNKKRKYFIVQDLNLIQKYFIISK